MYNLSIPISLNSVLLIDNWYKQPIVSVKQPIVFPVLCFCFKFWKTEFLIKVFLKYFHSRLKSLRKSFLNNSPPLSFKAIYSNIYCGEKFVHLISMKGREIRDCTLYKWLGDLEFCIRHCSGRIVGVVGSCSLCNNILLARLVFLCFHLHCW